MAPLLRVAEQGIPGFLVPGNQERSRIPLHLWTAHPNIYVFDTPKTFLLRLGSRTLALAGFPFCRDVRDRFAGLVRETGHDRLAADARLLCMHQVAEGAQVGASNYNLVLSVTWRIRRRGPIRFA